MKNVVTANQRHVCVNADGRQLLKTFLRPNLLDPFTSSDGRGHFSIKGVRLLLYRLSSELCSCCGTLNLDRVFLKCRPILTDIFVLLLSPSRQLRR
jgi:hypothetical protein